MSDGFFGSDYWDAECWANDYWGTGGVETTPFIAPRAWTSRRQKLKGRPDPVTPLPSDLSPEELDREYWKDIRRQQREAAKQREAEKKAQEEYLDYIRAEERKREAAELVAKLNAKIAKQRRHAERVAALKARGRDEADVEKLMEQAFQEENAAILTVIVALAERMGVSVDSLGANPDVEQILTGAVPVEAGAAPEEETVG